MRKILIDVIEPGHYRIETVHAGQGSIDAVNRIFWQGGDEGFKRLIEIAGVLRFQSDFDFIIRQVEHRIGAEHELRKFNQQIIEHRGDDAFAMFDVNILEEIRRVAKSLFDGVKAFLENLRDAGENVNVTNGDDGRERSVGAEQCRTVGDVGHAQPRFVQIGAEALTHALFDIRMTDDFDAEAMGDAFDGDVIMGRADAAGSKNEIEALGKLGDLSADQIDFILDRRDLLHFDAKLAQLGAEKMRIDILGLAR